MNQAAPVSIPVRRSLAAWAALALFIVIFSYAFTLTMAAACVYIPYVLLTKFPAIQSLVLFLAGIAMAATILWSLVPRRDRFRPPGPRLDLAKHPQLVSELSAISASLNESPPREVYLTMEMNAWVAERGGTMGFGSRRVMGLGLPLLQVLTFRNCGPYWLTSVRTSTEVTLAWAHGSIRRAMPWCAR